MTRSIAFYVHPGHQLLDLAGPLDAFRAANAAGGRVLYDMRVLSLRGGQVVGNAGVPIDTHLPDAAELDTLVVVGGDVEVMRRPAEVAAVGRLADTAARVVGVCTGAYLLAEAGLLDGRRATTHWSCARDLQRRFPAVAVEPDRIFVADGRIWTSAGITAGIDLALALIEADAGIDLARAVARELVVYHRRPGGQSQFSGLSLMDPESDRMRLAIAYAREHLAEALPVERLAEAARLSPRQFGRSFRAETGETPAKAVERLRVEAARLRIEEGSEPVEVIARAVGFADPERMRRAFVKRFGHPPQALRRISAPLHRTKVAELAEAPRANEVSLRRRGDGDEMTAAPSLSDPKRLEAGLSDPSGPIFRQIMVVRREPLPKVVHLRSAHTTPRIASASGPVTRSSALAHWRQHPMTLTCSTGARMLRGSCRCGAVTYVVLDEFTYAVNCHCSRCRRATGAAFKSLAGIERAKLSVTGDEDDILIVGASGWHEERCARCGSLLFAVVRDGAVAHVAMGSLVDDPTIRPSAHIFVGSKAPWFTITDDLPQFEEHIEGDGS